jgi:hypothetical protein
MPATLTMPSAQLIGRNQQEWENQTQITIRPHLKLPIGFATADAAVLFTVPTLTNGAVALQIDSLWWEITTGWTGGSSSAIGISSSNTKYATKGDLLGGATGDVAATLVSTNKYVMGTAGAKYATAVSTGRVFLVAADTIRFDQITSAFTAGAGFLHINCSFID